MSEPGLKIPDAKPLNPEFAKLRAKLEEAESTLDAIRTGAVDALVVRGAGGDQVFTLRGADEPYRIFVETMQDGAVTLDEGGTVLYCNRAFANILGEPLERVIGTQFQDYMLDAAFPEGTQLSISELSRAELKLSSPSGGVPVLCSVTPIEIDGSVTFAVTVTDLSEQKEHEAKLTRATAELEGFCYSVSHDLRAPLRSIISGASIVLEDYSELLPDVAARDLRRIASSANHLAQLMDDLLTYSRLATQETRRESIDLSSLARRVAGHIGKHGAEDIVWKIEPDLHAVGDPRFLELVLNNLLSNSAKFSAQRNPPEIQFGKDQDSGAFFVRDNGIGFSMAYIEKLFRPFERLHRAADYPGTGIGLANVKRIVTRQGGSVWAQGEEGKGATFFFTLP